MASRLLDVTDGRGSAALAVATVAMAAIAHQMLAPKKQRILPSPLKTTLPYMTPEEIEALDYPVDALPGARDVNTSHGSIRVYEWGPEDGPRVLFIHGISTPCVILRKLADPLVARGYRVMLFDLFGRGYSDGVGDIPHDAALYVTQAMYALTSSAVSWTGANALHVVGYSLGGGIAVHFAGVFPQLVRKLVLVAPAGMIRPESFGVAQRLVFTSGMVPEWVLAFLTGLRLQKPIASSVKRVPVAAAAAAEEEDGEESGEEEDESRGVGESFVDLASAEVQPVASEDDTPLEVRMRRYVTWMVKNHAGFVPSFMSCVRHAPLMEQQEAYVKLASRSKGSTLVLLAKSDEIILPQDFKADALPLMGGRETVTVRELPGGHDFVVTQSAAIVKAILKAWA
ncbi:hypothetical protein TD95_004227 [Thielaviopsis punctulata]|uniref:AB hydrolase-1 domain-containing protein n=1 Tax=Thielaviopsis punctulata TaxID=72032 RepID=A0A0F4ZDG3_9PEZI|nr:hypothetical protein TD95_004227 [Thielaviopsis punctulata]